MSGGKGRGKQSRDTASEDALVARPGATDPLLAAREGATDAQIDALRQGLPHLADPSLQDSRAGKQSEVTGTTEEGRQAAAQKKRARSTLQATQTPPLLAADAFVAALAAVPAEDWCRTWAAGRTIMLRMTSKRVKEVVDKMRLPAVVRLSRSFWNDGRNGTGKAKRQFVLRQLRLMTTWCRITTLALPECDMKGQDAERLAGVLAQCPALAHLDLRELVHLNLSGNDIGIVGAERLAGVLAQCTALAHLNLCSNRIEAAGAKSLARVLAKCTALAHLDLWNNLISDAGAERLAGVLAQCTALAHLNLGINGIGPAGAESLAGVLGQCAALAHLDVIFNKIGPAGAERLAAVLAQCPVLAHLDIRGNKIGTVGRGRLRASWRGQASGLLL